MKEHVLVAGASGLVGSAAMQHFAERGYRTTAVSRRRPIDTFGAVFVPLDLADAKACNAALDELTDVSHLVFAALHEESDLVAGWQQEKHVELNAKMLRNLLEPLERASPTLRHVSLVQGAKAYGIHVRPLREPAREDRDEMREIANFYWAQEDYIREKQIGKSWNWTVFRPGLVIGMAVGGAMNLVAALGVYGALLREKGQPLLYPGGVGPLLEVTDTSLMAHAFEWAAAADAAANQVFNVTNGELFSLREQWPTIAGALGMEPGAEVPMSLAETLPAMAPQWNAIRDKYHLVAPGLDAFIGQSFQYADLLLARGSTGPVSVIAMSSIKIRAAGFNEVLYTDEMLAKWLRRYQTDRLLPPA